MRLTLALPLLAACLVAGNARAQDAATAAQQNTSLGQPVAREEAQRRLAALPADAALRDAWEAQRLINGVADHGPANHASGPAIARFLDKRFDEDLRANAALALGRVEDRSSIPALLALAPELTDDWLLAYNVSESLGRLRATEAWPLLERLARDHWHRGVRNNAARALTMIAGGPFVPDDRASSKDSQARLLYFGNVRRDDDEAARSCAAGNPERRPEYDGRARWAGPAAAALARTPERDRPGWTMTRDVAQRIPEEIGPGSVVAVDRLAGGTLVGLNGGEFGGGLVYLPESGAAQALFDEPVGGLWRMGGRIYVAAGLSHLVLDYGHLYVIDPAGPRIERVIRLPGSPTGLTAIDEHVVVIETYPGDVAVRDDGTLLDAALATGCDRE